MQLYWKRGNRSGSRSNNLQQRERSPHLLTSLTWCGAPFAPPAAPRHPLSSCCSLPTCEGRRSPRDLAWGNAGELLAKEVPLSLSLGPSSQTCGSGTCGSFPARPHSPKSCSVPSPSHSTIPLSPKAAQTGGSPSAEGNPGTPAASPLPGGPSP